MEPLSPSSLLMYISCNYKYGFYKKVGLKRPSSSALEMGRVVHKACELVSNKFLKTPEEVERYIVSGFNSRKNCFAEVKGYEQFFLSSSEARERISLNIFEAVSSFDITDTEVEVSFDVEIDTETQTIYGYVDAIATNGDIIDWKFAKARKLSEDYKTQLVCYATILGRGEVDRTVHLVVFPKLKKLENMGTVVHTFHVTIAMQKKMLRTIGTVVKCIQNDVYIPNRTGGNMFCSSCTYRYVCDKELKGEFDE